MTNLPLPFDLSLLIEKTGTYRSLNKNLKLRQIHVFFIFIFLMGAGRISLGFCHLILLNG